MDDPGRCGWDEIQHRGKRSERRGRKNQHDAQGCQAYRWSDLDPIHEHHKGPRRMHAALERPDIRQYLTACHELFEFLLALQGGVHIRVVIASQNGNRNGAGRYG